VRLITTGILLALMAGIAIKLKLFGPSSYPVSQTIETVAAVDGGKKGMQFAHYPGPGHHYRA
jgi:hypothetical protein